MFPLHKQLIDAGLIEDHSTVASHADGEFVFPSDSPNDRAYFAVSGRAEIKRETEENSELLGEIGRGQLFVERGTTRNKERGTAIRAKGNLQTVAIDPEALLKLTSDCEQTAELIALLGDIYTDHDCGSVLKGNQSIDGHTVIVASFQDDDMHPVVVQYGSESVAIQTQQKNWSTTPKPLDYTDQNRNIERRLQVIDTKIVGAYLTGPADEAAQLIATIGNRKPLSHGQRASFENRGELFGRVQKSDYLCICMRLTHSQLKSEIEKGSDTAEALCRATGASSVCGTCLEPVKAYVEQLKLETHTTDTTLAQSRTAKKDPKAPDFISLGLGIATCIITLIGLSIPLGSHTFHQWQASDAGRWWSGGAFLCFLGYQWWMPIYRWSGRLTKADSLRNTHRRIGACMPLLLLFHNTSYGAGMLNLLTIAVLLHTIIGVADSSLISGQHRQRTYLQIWLFPHILLAFSITGLALYHVWVILTHGGP